MLIAVIFWVDYDCLTGEEQLWPCRCNNNEPVACIILVLFLLLPLLLYLELHVDKLCRDLVVDDLGVSYRGTTIWAIIVGSIGKVYKSSLLQLHECCLCQRTILIRVCSIVFLEIA